MQIYFANQHPTLAIGSANIKAQRRQDPVRAGRFGAAAHPENSPFAQVAAPGIQLAAPSRETLAISLDRGVGEGPRRSGALHLCGGDCFSVGVYEKFRLTPGSPECFAQNQGMIES